MAARKLNAAFGLTWRRAPAPIAIRYILQGLDPIAVETAFRRHAVQLQAACAKPGQGSIALDGKTLRGSFDTFHDRAAAQMLSAFATDSALVLAQPPFGQPIHRRSRPERLHPFVSARGRRKTLPSISRFPRWTSSVSAWTGFSNQSTKSRTARDARHNSA